MPQQIRKALKEDIAGIKAVLDSSGLFPSELLDDMISDYLMNSESEDIWFVMKNDNQILGMGYCVPEQLTNGTYNLLAIAVRKELQGKGLGKKMMAFIENLLRDASKRILIVETSSDPQFELTRQFYIKLGYTQEAILRDFWDAGEDKVIFWKKL